MDSEKKLKAIRSLKIFIQLFILIVILITEGFILWAIINILNGLNYIENGNYLNIKLLYITIGLLILLFDIIIFSLARWIKIDICDLYCNDSTDQLEFRIHELVRMRNQSATNRGLKDKLVLIITDSNDDKRKEKQLVNFK